MKISTKARYGLTFLLDLAVFGAQEGRPITLKEIAQRQGISEKYLWQVVTPLKASGMVTALAGAGGGYLLASPLEKVSLLSIVETLEGEISLVGAAHETGEELECAEVTQEIWREVSEALASAMERITLAQIVERARLRARSMQPDYCI